MREIQLQSMDLQLAACVWGEPGQQPVIALHGWLDNLNSFKPLAERLEGVHMVAVDLPGHGLSESRSGNAYYNIWDDVICVFDVARQMGWERFSLLGHSRGAIIATLAAGTFPDRIDHLMLLDGIWPQPLEAHEAPMQLARSIVEYERFHPQSRSRFASFEDAVSARMQSQIPVSHEVAHLLAERGVRKNGDDFIWAADPRLKAASQFKLSHSHIDAFMKAIRAPVRLLLADGGLPQVVQGLYEALDNYPFVDVHTLGGGHHLHMESARVEEVAALAQALFTSEVAAHV